MITFDVERESYSEVHERWLTANPRPQFPRCPHPETVCRYLIDSMGRKRYRYQCLTCGGNVGQWIKKCEVPRDEPLHERDEALAQRWQQKKSFRYKAASDDWSEREDALFWAYYHAYLESPRWKALRQVIMERADSICECCRRSRAIDVHHKRGSYARLGEELEGDLHALCRNCHSFLHPHMRQAA